ncbi:MAG: hypothetical protein ACK55I_24400, partial [bacterium]
MLSATADADNCFWVPSSSFGDTHWNAVAARHRLPHVVALHRRQRRQRAVQLRSRLAQTRQVVQPSHS